MFTHVVYKCICSRMPMAAAIHVQRDVWFSFGQRIIYLVYRRLAVLIGVNPVEKSVTR